MAQRVKALPSLQAESQPQDPQGKREPTPAVCSLSPEHIPSPDSHTHKIHIKINP